MSSAARSSVDAARGELPEQPPRLGRPHPRVDHARRAAAPTSARRARRRAPRRRCASWICAASPSRATACSSARVRTSLLSAIPGCSRTRLLEERGRRPRRLRLERARLLDERHGARRSRRPPRACERGRGAAGRATSGPSRASPARRAPLRACPRRPCGPRALRAPATRSRARRSGAPATPVASRALLCASDGFAATSATYDARIRSARTFSSGAGRDAHQRVDEAAQVSQAPALLEQAHEALERLVERRVSAVRGEVVACRRGFVAGALLRVADLGEQPGLPRRVRSWPIARPEGAEPSLQELPAPRH